jgi:DNA repair protein RadA/Sms
VVLSFDGDSRSGLRILASGKNRFGQEGETAWFEMGPRGLSETDPGRYLSSGGGAPGSATSLPLAGRRALAVEVQALAVPTDGPARRHATGIDPRRFSLVAAVVDRVARIRVAHRELYGASSAGLRVDDPAADLAVAASLASTATGAPAPGASAFVGEISLNGQVRPAPGMTQRITAARAAGISTIFAAAAASSQGGITVVHVSHIREALRWARPPPGTGAASEEIEPG